MGNGLIYPKAPVLLARDRASRWRRTCPIARRTVEYNLATVSLAARCAPQIIPMHEGLIDILLLLTAAVITVGLARALRLPPLLAYLVAGMAVGPYGLQWLPHTKERAAFADFGVVFLMFSIGLEFSLARLFAMRRIVFGLGAAQMGATILVTLALALAVGSSWRYGFALGCAVAMSSTAIVMRLLAEREELQSAPGRQTVGVLLLQDLAVVPLMILIPALGSEASSLAPAMGIALLKGTIILAAVILLGQKLMRVWFDLVARQKSHELFVVNLLWLVVGLAFLTASAGLSLALGRLHRRRARLRNHLPAPSRRRHSTV